MAKKSVFEDGVANLLRAELESLGFKIGTVGDSMDILVSYFTNCKRIVLPCRYRVLEARGFTVPWGVKLGYWLLKWKFKHGRNIIPHLHKAIVKAQGKDAMLFDWDIHHFHLGLCKKDGFVTRTGNVLYAIVDKGVVYCITINQHQHWSDKDLLEIVNANWPHLLDSYRLSKDTHLTLNVDTEAIKNLRKANVNAMLELSDHSVVMGRGGGFSTDGSSTECVRWAISVRNSLLKAEGIIQEELNNDTGCTLSISDFTNYYRDGDNIVVADKDYSRRYGIIKIPSLYERI